MIPPSQRTCPICEKTCGPFDVVDFNKSCAEADGINLKPCGLPIYYYVCDACGFCFAPEIYAWTNDQIKERIYNNAYKYIDPDYSLKRPQINQSNLMTLFGQNLSAIKHLDYGGGDGLLARMLQSSGWNSVSYDPFVNTDVPLESVGTFDFITAFEVFEHVTDVNALMSTLRKLLAPTGLVFFSTTLSDGFITSEKRLDWWYAAPRNGHVSLFSEKSLGKLAHKHGFAYDNKGSYHFLWSGVPPWAAHLARSPTPATA